MNILEKICRDKIVEVNERLQHITVDRLTKNNEDTFVPKDFRKALQAPGISVIAECKAASPSKGRFREIMDPVVIGSSYARNGANALSIVTEEKYFQGSIDFLKQIRGKVDIPVLRKDFIVDARQIRESYELGADAILLIVSWLSDQQLKEYQEIALSFGLTCVVEIHSEEELERATGAGANLIGINNRDLNTFQVDLQHSVRMRPKFPKGAVCVSESGINGTADCQMLEKAGYDAILVGEHLLRHEDPGIALKALMGRA